MSILWADDFRSYSDIDHMLDGLYAQVRSQDNPTLHEVSIVTDPDTLALYNSKAAKFPAPSATGNTFNAVLRYVLDEAEVTFGHAFRLYVDELPLLDKAGFSVSYRDSNNVDQLSMYVKTTGAIALYKGSIIGGTLLATTSIPVITAHAWHHIEVKGTINDTTGAFELRVNTIPRLELTGIDTQATLLTEVAQIAYYNHTPSGGGDGGDSTSYIKDTVYWDTAGTSNNDFLGNVSVLRRTVTSDTSLDWTPSTGSEGYSLLDETGPVDTDYISAGTPFPDPSQFGLENLPSEVTSVKAVIMLGRMQKSDGGDGNVQMGMVSGGDVGLGTDRPMTTAFTYWKDVIEVDPDTSTAWTPSGFNAASIQVDRTA